MSSAYDSAVLADSPVGFWPLDESSGTTANDQSGNSDNGTYEGTAGTNYTLGQTGIGDGETSVLFDGTAGYVQVPNAADLELTTAGSLEIWVKPSNGPNGLAIGKYNSGNGAGYYIYGNGSAMYLRLDDSSGNGSFAVSWPPNGTLAYIVVTWDGTNVVVYRDGSVYSTSAYAYGGPSGDTSAITVMGAAPGTGNGYQGGDCAKAAIYNYALTSTQVAAHYSAATQVSATGTGTYTFTGTASGSVSFPATGAGSYTFSGAATGTSFLPATGAGSYTFTGTAAGRAVNPPPAITLPTTASLQTTVTSAALTATNTSATVTGITTTATLTKTETTATIHTADLGG